ncbi:hypothetical protein M407DRAFT_33307 [Tulasnella calospora MUT 4182]|uniref:Uncharacterized protein n=1 Tax=Tulasnella calospora MUT 4182 TaxID=1051891 RepID=A0A0C3Q2K0_9AGAM|nr:hypothetical protein M407DRAFT_33307 [Tulasnella calospora MUT 4182]
MVERTTFVSKYSVHEDETISLNPKVYKALIAAISRASALVRPVAEKYCPSTPLGSQGPHGSVERTFGNRGGAKAMQSS